MSAPAATTNERPLLQVEGLTVTFGSLAAVDDVSMDVKSGEILSLIGPNGAGKSTLVNALTGLVRPSAGRFWLGGEEVTSESVHALAALGIARTFQNIQLFDSMTVLENVVTAGQSVHCQYGLRHVCLRPARVREQERRLDEIGRSVLDRFGLSARLGERPSSLSYGQQRALELARVTIRRPRVAFLDEPAAGLTPAEAEVLKFNLRELSKEGMTIVLIEHNLELVMEMSDRIVVLMAGEKVADDLPAAVRVNPRVLEGYMGAGL